MASPQQPTQQQLQAQLAHLTAEAQKRGMSVEAYVNELKAQAMRAQQQQQQQQQQRQQAGNAPGEHVHGPGCNHGHGQGQQVPIQPGPPDPKSLAVASWLRSQDLKVRTCILNGQRKDMFKVKRAIRALETPAYTAARKKNPLLPEVKDRATAEEVFKLLPLSLLALRVSKADPHEGHGHAPAKPTKRTKGLWTVNIEQQQEIKDTLHYVWLYDGPQWKAKIYAIGALLLIFAVVLFPLWPASLRLGVWYLSMGMLGLLGLFFAMSIFRLILFVVTMFAVPPGLWLYPNLFEDVGFFDSFRPVWGWQEDKKQKKKRKTSKEESSDGQAMSTGYATAKAQAVGRAMTARVEEVDDE
ncbi:MAG: Translocation protein S62 [Vezdaea aestivalis]|nr:MAG: Translocation protein S62 [Vezdaea aestivalis]